MMIVNGLDEEYAVLRYCFARFIDFESTDGVSRQSTGGKSESLVFFLFSYSVLTMACRTFAKFIIILILSILAIPAVLILILVNLIAFILRLPFYLYHKCKYEWCYSNIKSILPPVTMGFTTKVFYHGPNPCYDGNTFITVSLYLNKQVTTQLIQDKASFLYEFSRFRYIPHRSWLTGISQFSHANDTDEIKPNDISPHIHLYNDTENNPLSNTDEIQEAINTIANTEINRNIPWWDIHVINCDVDNFKSVIVFRCDHCLGDGATLLKFIMPRLLSDADGNAIEFDIKPKELANSSW